MYFLTHLIKKLELSWINIFYVELFDYLNPSSGELIYLNFCPLEVVSRYDDPQLQVGEN